MREPHAFSALRPIGSFPGTPEILDCRRVPIASPLRRSDRSHLVSSDASSNMLSEVFLWLMRKSPTARRRMWRAFYQLMAH